MKQSRSNRHAKNKLAVLTISMIALLVYKTFIYKDDDYVQQHKNPETERIGKINMEKKKVPSPNTLKFDPPLKRRINDNVGLGNTSGLSHLKQKNPDST